VKREALIEGIWERDATTWTGGDEAHWLGWLDEPLHVQEGLDKIRRLAEDLQEEVDDVVLCGMGGSSLAPEVLRRSFQVDRFHVLDTTHPKAIRALEEKLDLLIAIQRAAHGAELDALTEELRDDSVAAERPDPVLRVYGWHPPALSVGAKVDLPEDVRRRCGATGVEIVHRDDLVIL